MVTEIGIAELTAGLPAPDGFLRILMFFGSTCGPCKATMPNYEAASDYFDALNAPVKCFKINAWEPAEQMTYCNDVWKIQGVPTFKAFFNGEVIIDRQGGGDEVAMKNFIHECIDEVFKRFGVKL